MAVEYGAAFKRLSINDRFALALAKTTEEAILQKQSFTVFQGKTGRGREQSLALVEIARDQAARKSMRSTASRSTV